MRPRPPGAPAPWPNQTLHRGRGKPPQRQDPPTEEHARERPHHARPGAMGTRPWPSAGKRHPKTR
eukprot:344519-Lingulodinium_polyedra.AAC.1